MQFKEKHDALMAECDRLIKEIDAGLKMIFKRLALQYPDKKRGKNVK